MSRFDLRCTFAAVAAICAQLMYSVSAQGAGMNPPYFAVEPPIQVSTTTKIEVAEVFSYGCSHCAEFQPLVDAWRKKLDAKKVEFVYVPAPYSKQDVLFARGYFAASTLGVVEKTHHGVFRAVHERGISAQTIDDLAALYEQLGVPADKFLKAANDFYVETQVRRTYDLMVKFKIDGTPTLIVAGKYRITAASAGSQEEMIKVADKLIAALLTQSTATSRQAPKSGK